nr:hypothetical protein GCM10020092_057530 [Actinoplanes digitatis]
MAAEDELFEASQPVRVAGGAAQDTPAGRRCRVGVGEGEVRDAVVDLRGQAPGVRAEG